MDTPSLKPDVTRRRVHYFGGFDPRGPAYYHRLMKEEAARPQPGGFTFETGPRRKQSKSVHAWTVRCHPPGGAPVVETVHEFMAWDDIIRAHWPRGPWALWLAFWQTYVGIVRDIDLRRVKRVHATAAITGRMPAQYLLCTLLAGLLAAGVLAVLIPGALGLAVGAVVGVAIVAGAWMYGRHKGLFWLLRIFAYNVRMGRGPIEGMPQRCQEWVDHIIERQQLDPVDEVLLVGHSVGTLVMIDPVDALVQDPRWQALQAGRKTCMLTLGQCIPFVALPPQAQAFRQALARLCDNPALAWLDVSALIDPLCFYMSHPLALTGMEAGRKDRPVRRNAKFFQMYSAARWAQIRRDKLRTHFLYLMTPERPGNFNLYPLLYGPAPFEQALA